MTYWAIAFIILTAIDLAIAAKLHGQLIKLSFWHKLVGNAVLFSVLVGGGFFNG